MEAFPDTIQTACKVADSSPLPAKTQKGRNSTKMVPPTANAVWMPAKQVKERLGLLQLGERSPCSRQPWPQGRAARNMPFSDCRGTGLHLIAHHGFKN